MTGASSQPSLVRAIRGPILLITIGTLFSIDHFGSYSFANTWPALLIIIGVLKLLERVGPSGPPFGMPPSGMGPTGMSSSGMPPGGSQSGFSQ